MNKIKLSKDELELMNYNDIAYMIIEEKNKKMKIVDLFKEVCNLLELSDEEYQSRIGDFFGLLSTDKRFIMLDGGYWDLKIKHNTGMVSIDEDDDDLIIETDEEETEDESNDNNESIDDEDSDDDTPDDDLADLVIIDDSDEENNM